MVHLCDQSMVGPELSIIPTTQTKALSFEYIKRFLLWHVILDPVHNILSYYRIILSCICGEMFQFATGSNLHSICMHEINQFGD